MLDGLFADAEHGPSIKVLSQVIYRSELDDGETVKKGPFARLLANNLLATRWARTKLG